MLGRLEFIYDENVTVDDLSFTIQAMGTEHVLGKPQMRQKVRQS